MDYKNIEVLNEGGIARIWLNRPDKLNSFTAEMHGELSEALTQIEAGLSQAEPVRCWCFLGADAGFALDKIYLNGKPVKARNRSIWVIPSKRSTRR